MTDKFYELIQCLDRFEHLLQADDRCDGFLERFDGWDKMDGAFFSCVQIALGGNKGIVRRKSTEEGIWVVKEARLPEKVEFIVYEESLGETDFPRFMDAESWPIMSRRMIDVLLSVGNFSHQIIPIDLLDHQDTLIKHDYVILNLIGLLDILDRDKSVYTLEPTALDPTKFMIWSIKKLRLIEPEGGFPPIFRVKNNKLSLYVSAQAKVALEAAGIKGLVFLPIRP